MHIKMHGDEAEPRSDDLKVSRRQLWKEKLQARKDRKSDAEKQEDDISNFLGSRGKVPQVATTDLDANHRTSTTSLQHTHNRTSPISDAPHVNAYSSPNKARPVRPRKNLRVKISLSPATIIGEGGEEAEEPTQVISLRKVRPDDYAPIRHQNQPVSYAGFGQAIPHPPSPTDARTPSSLLPRLLTTAVYNTAQSMESSPINQAPQDADYDFIMNGAKAQSRISVRQSRDDPDSLAGRIQAKMRADEGQALHKGIRETTTPSPTESGDFALPKRSEDPKTIPEVAAYSLNPTPAPAVHSQGYFSDQQRSHVTQMTADLNSLSMNDKSDLAASSAVPDAGSNQRPPLIKGPAVSSVRSIRTAAQAVRDDSLAEFIEHVAGYTSLFRLGLHSSGQPSGLSLSLWLRCSLWWFLKGRVELEAQLRSTTSANGTHVVAQPHRPHAQQAIVDLAKAWWIVDYVVPQHADVRRYGNLSGNSLPAFVAGVGDHQLASLLNLGQELMSYLRALTLSMKRNNFLPPVSEKAPLPQGLDTSLWLRYPQFAPEVASILSGSRYTVLDRADPRQPLKELMPLGDSKQVFTYSRMFVSVEVFVGNIDKRHQPIPCVLSIYRHPADWYVLAAVASQNNLVNVVIQPDRHRGPTWEDVRWDKARHTVTVHLPRGFDLTVLFNQADYDILRQIVSFTHVTEGTLSPENDEKVLFEGKMPIFQYIDASIPKAFPPEPSKNCLVHLFEKEDVVSEGSASRKAHRGFRLAVVTNPGTKTLSGVNHILGGREPIVWDFLRGEGNAPVLMLKTTINDQRRAMILTFADSEKRANFHAMLTSTTTLNDETKTGAFTLKSFAVEPQQSAESPRSSSLDAIRSLEMHSAEIWNQPFSQLNHPDKNETISSERLRIVLRSKKGTITDRMNIGMHSNTAITKKMLTSTLGPGALQIRLDLKDLFRVDLLRGPQADMTLAVSESANNKEIPAQMTRVLQEISVLPTIRSLMFSGLRGEFRIPVIYFLS